LEFFFISFCCCWPSFALYFLRWLYFFFSLLSDNTRIYFIQFFFLGASGATIYTYIHTPIYKDVGVLRPGHAALCGAFFMSRSAFYHICIHISTASALFVFMANRSCHINWPQSLKCLFFAGTGKAGNAKWKLPLKQFGKLYSKRYLLWATKGFRHL